MVPPMAHYLGAVIMYIGALNIFLAQFRDNKRPKQLSQRQYPEIQNPKRDDAMRFAFPNAFAFRVESECCDQFRFDAEVGQIDENREEAGE